MPTGTLGERWEVQGESGWRRAAWLDELTALYAEPVSCPASIAPEAGWLLYWLIRNIRPSTIVEVGTCLGASTIWMAAAMQENDAASGIATASRGVIHTFDDFRDPTDPRLAASTLFRDRRRGVEDRIARAGLSHQVRVHKGNSKVEIPRLHEELLRGGGVQFAYLDGDHSVEGVVGDLMVVEPVLQIGGYILLHDTFPELSGENGPRHLLDHVSTVSRANYQTCDICIAPVNFGMGLMRRIG